jgi:glyoxylase-like metal-dependent hydrolase (beta-lactamase superfamily II)
VVIPGLTATAPEPLPFAPSVHVRSYVLDGGLLVYGTGASDGLDGVRARYLNHWHETMFAAPLEGVPTLVHERDLDASAERMRIDGTFAEREVVGDDFEIVPLPGHTPGATAFLWRGALFTGDSIYLDGADWVVALDVSGSDRAAFLESLELVRELEYDVLVPWAASARGPSVAATDASDARRRIDAIIARVRRGESRWGAAPRRGPCSCGRLSSGGTAPGAGVAAPGG